MSSIAIENIDKNFRVETNLNEDDLCLYDTRKAPFDLYGLYNPREGEIFRRLPDDIAAATSEKVHVLAKNTAGGRVRFTTDSSYIAIKSIFTGFRHFPHMTLAGTAGFDLYIDEGGRSTYFSTFMPPITMTDGYESIIKLGSRKKRSFTIHFPLYAEVASLYIGLQRDATLDHGAKYAYQRPVLYYGSSITQGGCASRPGNCYTNIISAKLDCDHINLGFSGSAKGEDAIVNYMASLDFSVFVCDYDHNAPSLAHLKATHEKVYLTIRDAHPDTPIILVSRPDFDKDISGNILRRDVVYTTYINAIGRGDKNLCYIDGERLFKDEYRDACTVDTVHPNDAGFVRMAEVIGYEIGRFLRRTKES
ncbi:MAG: hypothetical protein GX303_02450 [Clostridiales bacterium]|nr:hypothetical protein [Clostridiales bacterium]